MIDLSHQLIEFGEQAAREYFSHVREGDHLQYHRQIGRVEGFMMEYFIKQGRMPGGLLHRLLVGPDLSPRPAMLVRVAGRKDGVMRWALKPQIVSGIAAPSWLPPDPGLLREVLGGIDRPPPRPSYGESARSIEAFADVWNMS